MLMTPQADELEFHIRELRYDIEGLTREVHAIALRVMADDAAQLHAAFARICAGVEHDYSVHSARALELARSPALAPGPSAEIDTASEERWLQAEEPLPGIGAAEDLLRELRPEIEELAARLRDAAAGVARVEALREHAAADPAQLNECLEHVHASVGHAMRHAFSAMRLVTCLDRMVNPERYQVARDE
jgi:hypothetical protein